MFAQEIKNNKRLLVKYKWFIGLFLIISLIY